MREKNRTRKCVYETLCPQPYACSERRFKSEKSATQTIKKVNQFINTLVCDCSSCASQLSKCVTYRHGVVRRCWVNIQCRGVLLIWIIVGQGPIALAVGAGGGCLDIFSLISHFSFLSPSLWETARYRLKYCLKGWLSPKQPTNHTDTNNQHFNICE